MKSPNCYKVDRMISSAITHPATFNRFMKKASISMLRNSDLIHPVFFSYHTSQDCVSQKICENVYLLIFYKDESFNIEKDLVKQYIGYNCSHQKVLQVYRFPVVVLFNLLYSNNFC